MNAACIATYCEAETIGDLVAELRRHGLNVYVVDDSPLGDLTADLARANGANVWQNTTRMGIGSSLMRAWHWALQDGADRIVQMDAGGSHRVRDALRIVNYDTIGLCIGSRFMGMGFMYPSKYIGNPTRAAMSRLATAMCNLRAGTHLTDWTSGLRAMDAHSAEQLIFNYPSRMHGWQIDVLARAIRLGMFIHEYPITYTAGRSSFDLPAAKEAFRAWLRL